MVNSLKKIGFSDVEESDFDYEFREIVVECDECGNITTTNHFFCGDFLPISMYCVRCRKHVLAHAHYKEN